VNVGAKAHVISEIPSYMVGVFVNRDVVAVPIPVIAVRKIKWGDTEIEAVKPEAAGIATLHAPPVCTAETPLEAAILPRVVDVEALVVAPAFVSHPFAVVVDVRSFGMILTVAIRTPVSVLVMVAFVRIAMIRLGPVARDVSSADVVVAVVVAVVTVFVSLCQGRQG
jgi:hypothetical protein